MELRTFFRSTDIVSRWGGDEFLVIVDCSAEEVHDRIEPVRKWVFGDYDIKIDGESRKVNVHASVGMASWRPGETAAELIARADAAMYQEKAQQRKGVEIVGQGSRCDRGEPGHGVRLDPMHRTKHGSICRPAGNLRPQSATPCL